VLAYFHAARVLFLCRSRCACCYAMFARRYRQSVLRDALSQHAHGMRMSAVQQEPPCVRTPAMSLRQLYSNVFVEDGMPRVFIDMRRYWC